MPHYKMMIPVTIMPRQQDTKATHKGNHQKGMQTDKVQVINTII